MRRRHHLHRAILIKTDFTGQLQQGFDAGGWADGGYFHAATFHLSVGQRYPCFNLLIVEDMGLAIVLR